MSRQVNTAKRTSTDHTVPAKSSAATKRGAAQAVIFVLVLALCLTLALGTVALIFKKIADTPKAVLDMPGMTSVIPPTAAARALPPSDIIDSIPISEAPPPPEPEPVLYNFANPVPESEAVDIEYFSDTVFIGDSRTQGLILYTSFAPFNFAAQGANVANIQTRSFIPFKNDSGEYKNHTLAEALERELGNYKAVYISMGVNELGWSVGRFIEQYALLVDMIREITDVPVYISLIMPVTTEFSETSDLKNEKAVQFNEKLRELAIEKSLFLLDPTGIHTLDDGSLDPEHSYDGAHLWPASYKELAEYYCTHTVDIYAYDNTRPPDEETDETESAE